MSHWCRWDYHAEHFVNGTGHDAIVARLNELGKEGWEVFKAENGVFWFKRQHPVMPAAQRPPSRPMPDLVRGAEKEEGAKS